MVGSTGTLMTMRLVRSKLRKREESASATPATAANIEAQQTLQQQSRSNSLTNSEQHYRQQQQQQQQEQQIFTTTTSLNECSIISTNNNINNNHDSNYYNANTNNNHSNQLRVTFTRTSGSRANEAATVAIANNNATSAATNNANSWVFPPKAPTPNIYNCINHDALLAANDKNGFKGFRKQFSGRFKRLVAKKPEPASVIPPELKPQLKTIYVY